ncbi:MAG: hypothetical protein J6P93_04850 [Alphaproteobacteria bacterium]|nr:hypothetical protein [Alphaproteobacteria bacterium]
MDKYFLFGKKRKFYGFVFLITFLLSFFLGLMMWKDDKFVSSVWILGSLYGCIYFVYFLFFQPPAVEFTKKSISFYGKKFLVENVTSYFVLQKKHAYRYIVLNLNNLSEEERKYKYLSNPPWTLDISSMTKEDQDAVLSKTDKLFSKKTNSKNKEFLLDCIETRHFSLIIAGVSNIFAIFTLMGLAGVRIIKRRLIKNK